MATAITNIVLTEQRPRLEVNRDRDIPMAGDPDGVMTARDVALKLSADFEKIA